jgi:hypothetical protein
MGSIDETGDLLLGSVASAIVSAWSRVAGALAIVRQAMPPVPPSRYHSAGDHLDRITGTFNEREANASWLPMKRADASASSGALNDFTRAHNK